MTMTQEAKQITRFGLTHGGPMSSKADLEIPDPGSLLAGARYDLSSSQPGLHNIMSTFAAFR